VDDLVAGSADGGDQRANDTQAGFCHELRGFTDLSLAEALLVFVSVILHAAGSARHCMIGDLQGGGRGVRVGELKTHSQTGVPHGAA
jgi:hypothetical protein